MSHQVTNLPADLLEGFAIEVFDRCGLPREHAEAVGKSLVLANLRGVDTHGVARIPGYVGRFGPELVNPRPRFEETSRFPWAVAIDADNAMGPVVAEHAMKGALARAASFGIGGATVRRSNHFGAASLFALQAPPEGCIGIVMSPASKSLAPYGSREPLFGTNPFAVAVPAGRHAPWVLDMATSVAARGHIRLAARRNEPIPEGWALDAEGRPTTNAQDALGGVMLPFAGPKGSALAMMVDIMGGVLAGSAFAGAIRDMNTDFEAPQDVGHFFLAINLAAFMEPHEFAGRMEEAIARLKSLEPAAGFDEVLYPGELEARRTQTRLKEGIPLTPEVVKALVGVGEELGVPFPYIEAAAQHEPAARE
ncbi:Ldh family oxidoreductase [Lutibaculum baratangense]|uniref:Malate dehydrogenase n=1 Tax=Lutibaculum baratangense AMV1 TaxID=631454 RepID=V4REF0_9HYPH|nr:Ldh family oxidoreductase [Lutibaculum baratangense]ESR24511.1 hypothetical protein N177_2345 [Lutibaculum baratangense AMV1]